MSENQAHAPSLDTQVGGDHYKTMKIQPVEFIHANGIPFLEGGIIKRACRWRNKNGIEDLRKIIHEAQLLIDLEEARQGERFRSQYRPPRQNSYKSKAYVS